MSEQGEKPEALPGDLITRPGLYESRSQGVVEVRHWGRDGWVAQWEDKERLYFSDGTRTGLYPMPDPYQLLHWVGPLPATEPEPQPEPEKLPEGCRNDGGWSNGVNGTEPEPWPELQPQPQPEPDTDAELQIQLLKEANDSQAETIGRLQAAIDERAELGGADQTRIELQGRIRELETIRDTQAAAIEELRSEVSYVQRMLGESRQRVTHSEDLVASLRTIIKSQEKAFEAAGQQNDALRAQVQNRQQEYERQKGRIEFLETLNAGNGAAIGDYIAKVAKLQSLVDTARGQLEAAATERDELRAAIDAADKQLDQKDAQIRDLRIELEAAQQVPQPVSDEERERIWDEATEAAGRQVMRWLRPLTLALHRQPDERFSRFMALTLSVLPDVLPELLGYAVEDESDCEE